MNDFNEAVLSKLLKSHDLEFHQLFVASPHVFISRKHPLAGNSIITNEELEEYPYLSFEQGEHNSFYFQRKSSLILNAGKYPCAGQSDTVQSADRPERLHRVQRRDR